MELLDPQLEQYCKEYTSNEPKLLAELNRDTHANVLMPRMLAGHLQGRAIAMLSHMIRPKTVLEIGTYTGYSALCWAEGLADGGVVHTLEVNDELERRILNYFNRSPLGQSIQLYIGQALEMIMKIEGPFDVVYIDADKGNYCRYFDAVINKVSLGGFIIADNVLWNGKVLLPEEKLDEETKEIKRYNEKVLNDERVENMLLPLRDGLMIARKVKC